MTLRAYLVRRLVELVALAVGYLVAGALVLALVMAACSAVTPRNDSPDVTPTPAPSAAPIEEWSPTLAPSHRPVVLPTGAPAGLDIEDLCAQLQAPGEVPECADLGY